MILIETIDRGDYEVFFTPHAITQAIRRGLDWEEIEGAVRSGTFKRMKNDRINIELSSAKGKTICVGIEFQPNKLKILTIESNEDQP